MDEESVIREVKAAKADVDWLMSVPPADADVFMKMSKTELVGRLRRAQLVCTSLEEMVVAAKQKLSDARRDLRAEKRRTKAMGEKISTLEAEAEQASAARAAVEQLLETGVLAASQLSDAGWPYELTAQTEEDVETIRSRAAAGGMHLYWMTLSLEMASYDSLGNKSMRESFATPVEVPGLDDGNGDSAAVGWVMTPEPVSPYVLEELWLVPDADAHGPALDDSMPVYAQVSAVPQRPMTAAERIRAEHEAQIQRPGAMPH